MDVKTIHANISCVIVFLVFACCSLRYGGTDASVHDGTGYKLDINDTRRHHEIYLSDARKVTPEKLKIVIRHPIRKK